MGDDALADKKEKCEEISASLTKAADTQLAALSKAIKLRGRFVTAVEKLVKKIETWQAHMKEQYEAAQKAQAAAAAKQAQEKDKESDSDVDDADEDDPDFDSDDGSEKDEF